jgi:hypothetical protein
LVRVSKDVAREVCSGLMVLPAMQSIVRRRRAVSSHRSLTASLTLGLLGCLRLLTMRVW